MSQEQSNLEKWHAFMEAKNPALLDDMLHDDAVFHSPVVHTPQRGKAITMAYLSAAGDVLGGDDFRYVREWDCGTRAVLEFECSIGEIHVNGVDLIEWNDEGKIVDFKVMVRPLKAIQTIHAGMAAMLEKMKPS